MLKYPSLFRNLFLGAALPCLCLWSMPFVAWAAQSIPTNQGLQTQQGMDIYGGAYVPPQAPAQPPHSANPSATPVAPATNSQGFQTFQVAPRGAAPSSTAPSFVQPPVQSAPHASGQVVIQTPGQTPGQNVNTIPNQAPIQTLRQGMPVQQMGQQPNQQAGQLPAQTGQPRPGATQQPPQQPTGIVPQNVPLIAPSAPPVATPPAPVRPSEADMDKTYLQAANSFSQAKYNEAIDTWQRLAAQGHAPSMVALGLLQDRGHSDARIPVNTKDALTWFRKSADLGHRDGMYHLGRMLVHGRGNATGQKHTDTAAVWFRKAADLGQHDAQYALGVLYERGEGVVRSLKDAVAWYSHAAAGQNVTAQARLGHLYHVGEGVPKNISRATLLLYGATMAGNLTAQEELFAMAKEQFPQDFPKVTLFGADLSADKGVTRATMRSALSVSKVPALREDINFICDVYDLGKVVPGSKEMAICYGSNDAKAHKAEQEIGFIKIDYPAKTAKDAKAIQDMVTQRFGPPIAGEKDLGHLWNLGPVIVATQFEAKNQEVGLMYMIPRVYHTTQSK